ncbi:hypothetical protein K8I31_03335, partial [bacterium]|nr:hypothetical protein [bacterium]
RQIIQSALTLPNSIIDLMIGIVKKLLNSPFPEFGMHQFPTSRFLSRGGVVRLGSSGICVPIQNSDTHG